MEEIKVNKIRNIKLKEEKISDWNICIFKCYNGYLCTWNEESIKNSMVFDIKDENSYDQTKDELEAMRNLLLFIMEHFGVFCSKHNRYNLDIQIKENKGVE